MIQNRSNAVLFASSQRMRHRMTSSNAHKTRVIELKNPDSFPYLPHYSPLFYTFSYILRLSKPYAI